MTYFILCSTPMERRRRVLRMGERMRVGTSAWVEWSLPISSELAEEHFEIVYQDRLTITPMAGTIANLDGTPIESTIAISNTRLLAGPCTFSFESVFADPAQSELSNELTATVSIAIPKWADRNETIEMVKLSTAAQMSIANCDTPVLAVSRLIDELMQEDALRLIAGCLDPTLAVGWCLSSFQKSKLAVPDEVVCSQLNDWRLRPNETLRSQIFDSIDWKKSSSPWTWIKAAVGWTGGSLSPLNSPVIPPPPCMFVSAIIACMQLASCQTDLVQFRIDCCELGLASLRSQANRK